MRYLLIIFQSTAVRDLSPNAHNSNRSMLIERFFYFGDKMSESHSIFGNRTLLWHENICNPSPFLEQCMPIYVNDDHSRIPKKRLSQGWAASQMGLARIKSRRAPASLRFACGRRLLRPLCFAPRRRDFHPRNQSQNHPYPFFRFNVLLSKGLNRLISRRCSLDDIQQGFNPSPDTRQSDRSLSNERTE